MINKQTLQDFVTVSVIGKGSWGKVVLAKHKASRQLFALKIMKKSYLEQNFRDSLPVLQKNILLQLKHPFIIKLQFSFQTPDSLYLALEYCPGGQLYSHIERQGRLDEQQTRLLSAQVLLAIQHLHKKGIVLKPQNILIAQDGYIKMVDFGLSKRNMLAPQIFSLCGTMEYLAPQVILRKACGFQLDWWCLGVLIYEMTQGKPAFHSQNQFQIFQKIKNVEISFPFKVSPQCQDLIQNLLEKDPSKRLGHDSIDQIKQHPFFAAVDFDKLLEKKYKPKFIPNLKGQLDLKYFSKEFLQESVHQLSEVQKSNKIYEDFSFNGEQLD